MAAENGAGDARTVGQLLRAYRVAAGLTQRTLASRAGVGEQTISYMERDLIRRPHLATMGLLAAALGLSEEERQGLDRARRRQPPRIGRGEHPGGQSPAAIDGRAAPIVNLFVPPPGEAVVASPAHLVTLIGPSRETTAVALAAHDLFHARGYDNVFFVSLAGIETAARLPGAILAALTSGIETTSSPSALLDYLRPRHLLLIVDRCERLIDPCAALIDAILQQCPAVCVLATCTEPLHVEGEVVRRIAPLA